MSSIIISDIMERHIKNICTEVLDIAVRQLGNKYGFDHEKAIAELNLPTFKRTEAISRRKDANDKSKKTPNNVPAIPLPFCGVINDTWCHAIVKNSKLFTQCTNLKNEQGDYCKKCSKIAAKEGSMPFGDIQERIECPLMEFKDPKGVQVVPYAVVMKKLNITPETAIAEAAKFGWTIDEAQFNLPEKARGRPKKNNDEESSQEEKTAAKRGRPKKDKPLKASSKVGDDIIAGLLAQAKSQSDDDESESNSPHHAPPPAHAATAAPAAPAAAPKMNKEQKAAAKAAKEAEKEAAKAAKDAAKAAKEAKAAEKNATKTKKDDKKITKPPTPPPTQSEENSQDDDDEEEEETAQEIKVKKFEFKGKLYKRSEPDNILYDWENDEPVGVWNPKTNKIDQLPSEDDDEEDEDE